MPQTPTPATARAVRYDGFGGREVLRERGGGTHPRAGRGARGGARGGDQPRRGGHPLRGAGAGLPSTFPSGQGADLAGVVLTLGGGDTGDLAVGEEVLGWVDTRSSHATHAVVPAVQLVAKPAALAFEVAGSLFVAGTAAHVVVQAVAPCRGETVVVSAAAGAGSLVIPDARRARGAGDRRRLGGQRRLAVRARGHPRELRRRPGGAVRAAAPDGVDALIDLFGPDYLDLGLALGVKADRLETIISFERACQIGAKDYGGLEATDPATIVADIAAAAGIVEVPIAATYPLERVADAYAQLEQRHTRGKIILVP